MDGGESGVWKEPARSDWIATFGRIGVLGASCGAAVLTLGGWTRLLSSGDARPSLVELIVTSLIGAAITVLGVVLAKALRRQEPWAYLLAALFLTTLGGIGVVWVAVTADDSTDSGPMALLGALEVLVGALAISAGLVFRRLRPPCARASWFVDPATGSRWRYWDGHRWTDHTAPF